MTPADPSSIFLYRYDDFLMGPRTKPAIDDMLKGKTRIPPDSVFTVNMQSKSIGVNVEGSVHNVGNDLMYVYQSFD